MTLSRLIQKDGLTKFATATPATHGSNSTVAVAKAATKEPTPANHWRYLVTLPNGETFESKNWPPVTADELTKRYPGARIHALPDHDPPKRKPSLSELAELKDLARMIYRDESEQGEALELALLDIDGGLLVLRQLAALEITDRRQCGQVCCRECIWFVADNRACRKDRAPTPTTLWRRCEDYKQTYLQAMR